METADSPETLPPPSKLPLFKTVGKAYRFTFTHVADFLRIAWAWLLIGAAVMFALGWFVFWPLGYATNTNFSSQSFMLMAAPSILDTFIGASLAVTWHRFVLLHEPPGSTSVLRVDNLVGGYFAWALALAAITWALVLIVILPVSQLIASHNLPLDAASSEAADSAAPLDLKMILIMAVFVFFAGAPFMFIPTRMSLKLPALALERADISARQSWLRTKGNFWRLYTGTWAGILPISLAASLVINPDEKTRLGYSLNQSLTFLVGIVAGMVGITFLSLAFRHFFGATAPTADTADTA